MGVPGTLGPHITHGQHHQYFVSQSPQKSPSPRPFQSPELSTSVPPHPQVQVISSGVKAQ